MPGRSRTEHRTAPSYWADPPFDTGSGRSFYRSTHLSTTSCRGKENAPCGAPRRARARRPADVAHPRGPGRGWRADGAQTGSSEVEQLDELQTRTTTNTPDWRPAYQVSWTSRRGIAWLLVGSSACEGNPRANLFLLQPQCPVVRFPREDTEASCCGAEPSERPIPDHRFFFVAKFRAIATWMMSGRTHRSGATCVLHRAASERAARAIS